MHIDSSQLPLRKKFLKVLLFYLAIRLISFGAGILIDLPILNIFKFETLLPIDASFNDLHYQQKNETNVVSAPLSGKLILINTGSIPKDSFRLNLSEVISKTRAFEPKVIALDHDFINDSRLVGTAELIKEINSTKNILVGKTDKITLKFSSSVKYTDVSFPDNQITVRRYSSDTNTFAYQIAKTISESEIKELPNNNFFINYLATNESMVSKDSGLVFDFFSADEKQNSFLVFEASDILAQDSVVISKLSTMVKGKALVMGNISNTFIYNPKYDIEDKFKAPFDKMSVDRDKIMPGVLIHANAVENILNPENRFVCISDSILFKFFKELIVFFYLFYVLFYNYGKGFNFLCLIFLTFPLLLFVNYLMSKNIYLEIGLTLFHFIFIEEILEIIESVPIFLKRIKKQ
jgi:hypothetical protein